MGSTAFAPACGPKRVQTTEHTETGTQWLKIVPNRLSIGIAARKSVWAVTIVLHNVGVVLDGVELDREHGKTC